MSLAFFTIPVRDSAAAEAELNGFMQSHKVLTLDRRLIDNGPDSFWTVCVDYLEHGKSTPPAHRTAANKNAIDYKLVLKPDEFAVFAKLRELRKSLATAEAVPVYKIFTNEHLATMARDRVTTKAGMAKVAGIGEARIEKYGPKVLELLAKEWKDSREASGESAGSNRGQGQPSSGVPQGAKG